MRRYRKIMAYAEAERDLGFTTSNPIKQCERLSAEVIEFVWAIATNGDFEEEAGDVMGLLFDIIQVKTGEVPDPARLINMWADKLMLRHGLKVE